MRDSFIFTLCFLMRGDQVLMLHRRRPPNQNLWNGVGGRIETGESPLAACLREVHEETGYRLTTARFAGLLAWSGFELADGGLYLFTADAPDGEPVPGPEGELRWWPRDWVLTSPAVVSNVRLVGPYIFDRAPPQLHRFEYQDGQLVRHTLEPLPEWAQVE